MSTNESIKERNKRVVMEIWEGFYNQGDVNAFLENVTDDYVWRSDTLYPSPRVIVGKEQAISYTLKLSELLPGVRGEVLSLEANDDSVTLVALTSASRNNGYLGLPEIDRPMKFHQCLVNYLTEEGKVRETIFFYDRVILLQQLGALPEISVFGAPNSVALWAEYVNPRFLFPHNRYPKTAAPRQETSPSLANLLMRLLRLPAWVFFQQRGGPH